MGDTTGHDLGVVVMDGAAVVADMPRPVVPLRDADTHLIATHTAKLHASLTRLFPNNIKGVSINASFPMWQKRESMWLISLDPRPSPSRGQALRGDDGKSIIGGSLKPAGDHDLHPGHPAGTSSTTRSLSNCILMRSQYVASTRTLRVFGSTTSRLTLLLLRCSVRVDSTV